MSKSNKKGAAKAEQDQSTAATTEAEGVALAPEDLVSKVSINKYDP